MDEILYLSRKSLLRKKKKKIIESHEKTITNSISVNNRKVNDNLSGNNESCLVIPTSEDDHVERCSAGVESHYSSARESLSRSAEYIAVPAHDQVDHVDVDHDHGDLPQLVVTTEHQRASDTRVPITYSWPSLEGHVSVHNPSIDSNNSNIDSGELGKTRVNHGVTFQLMRVKIHSVL